MRGLLVLVVFGLLMSCGGRSSSHWEKALAVRPDETIRSGMDISVVSKPLKLGLSSRGALATDGTSIRMEWRSPMGTTQLRWLMHEGVWTIQLPKTKLNLVASDAEKAMRHATDGVMGLQAFQQLLLGQFSWLPPQVHEGLRTVPESHARVGLANGQFICIELDERREYVHRLSAENKVGETLLSIEYGAYKDHRPMDIRLQIPRIEFTLTAGLSGWDRFIPTNNIFVLPSRTPFETVDMEALWPVILSRLFKETPP